MKIGRRHYLGMLVAEHPEGNPGNKSVSGGLVRRQVQRDKKYRDTIAIIPGKRDSDA